jgi:hypothetical protein
MDTKRLITMMLISFAVIFGWELFVAQLYKSHPEWRKPGQQPVAATMPATTGPTTQQATTQALAAGPTTGPAGTRPAGTRPGPQMSQYTGPTVRPATNPVAVTLGDDDASRMIVKISPTGAAVESVTLKEFMAPGGKGAYIFQTPYDPQNPITRAMATLSITIDGQEVGVADKDWNQDEQFGPRSAVYSLDLG